MLEVGQILEVKQLSAKGLSIRAIAKQMTLSRNTVRRYLRGESTPGVYQLRRGRKKPVADLIGPVIRRMLESEHERETPRKQRFTAARVHRLLKAQGFHASDSTVRGLVRSLRQELRDPLAHAYLPLEYDPGVDAQVDFFEGEVDDLEQGRVKVHILLVRACYSTRTFAYAAPNQTREALLEGLIRAFEYFGGVFRCLWFDNLTPAVRKVLKGRTRILQTAFASFVAHYGFRPEFCAPGKGNEKGGVENCVKYSRHEILSPLPTVSCREDIQKLCGEYMDRELDRIPRGRKVSIGHLWKDEVEHLLPLPACPFDATRVSVAKVTPRSWVSVGTNFYSVPVHLVGRRVTVKLGAEQLVILDDKEEVACHQRNYRRHQMMLDLDHYLPLLQRKHRGLDHAIPVRHWLAREAPCWRTLMHDLRRKLGEVSGSKAFVEVLMLCPRYGVKAVTAAVEKSITSPEVSLETVRYHIAKEQEAAVVTPPLIAYKGPASHQGPLAAYMDLCLSTEVSHV